MSFKFNTTQEIIDDIRDGKIIVLLDDEDRENEGGCYLCSRVCHN